MAVIKCGECKGNVSTSAKACPHCGAKPRKFKRNPLSAKQKFQVAGAIFAVLVLSNFIPKDEKSSDGFVQYQEDLSVEPIKVSESPNKNLERKICKAAIATAFYKSPDIISTEFKSGIVELSYRREADGSLWRYRCDVEGDSVTWAGFIDGDWGRWRNSQRDASITYKMNGDRLIISELSLGTSKPTRKSFEISTL